MEALRNKEYETSVQRLPSSKSSVAQKDLKKTSLSMQINICRNKILTVPGAIIGLLNRVVVKVENGLFRDVCLSSQNNIVLKNRIPATCVTDAFSHSSEVASAA